MSSYMPIFYDKLTQLDTRFLPNTVKGRNNLSFGYWQRSLFQRACSTLIFDLPENWQGATKDFFYYCLFRFGYVVVFNTPEYGVIFQPCTLKGYNVFYQPTTALVANPVFKKNKEIELGQAGALLKLTPDYMGIFDIIDYYADKISEIDGSLASSLINSKVGYMVGSSTKAGAEALKKMLDKINRGEPAVIFDNKLIQADPITKDKPFVEWDRKVKDNYMGFELLRDMETLLYNFDSEVGIPTINNGQKKERMVVSEAESRTIDATSRSIVWFDTLQTSLKEVNHMFNLNIDVSLRYTDSINTNDDIDNDEIEGVV